MPTPIPNRPSTCNTGVCNCQISPKPILHRPSTFNNIIRICCRASLLLVFRLLNPRPTPLRQSQAHATSNQLKMMGWWLWLKGDPKRDTFSFLFVKEQSCRLNFPFGVDKTHILWLGRTLYCIHGCNQPCEMGTTSQPYEMVCLRSSCSDVMMSHCNRFVTFRTDSDTLAWIFIWKKLWEQPPNDSNLTIA